MSPKEDTPTRDDDAVQGLMKGLTGLISTSSAGGGYEERIARAEAMQKKTLAIVHQNNLILRAIYEAMDGNPSELGDV